MIAFLYTIIYVLVFATGAVMGSFLNVLIYRVPRGMDFVKGYSMCPNCEHRLYPKDLVPIFSYLFLGRKCRYCKEPISPRYMLIETLMGGLALLSCFAFTKPTAFLSPGTALPGSYAGIAAATLCFAALFLLVAITFIDMDTMEIYDSMNLALLVCGIAAIWLGPSVTLASRFIGLFCVSVPLFAIAFFIGGAFGGGDVKLMAAAGFLLGWQCVLLALFIGIVLGGIYAIAMLAMKKLKKGDHFAFGPALCTGIAISMFAGDTIIKWYLGFLL
ncbi:MAG: prepilin peptidase [Clostridiales Family XIII bacterium]|jgi:leader peptidase (prepilin peptidase)/N-methyltransferase|nr:prepilin peptidase [Clostridiales Family XIII bacterium]